MRANAMYRVDNRSFSAFIAMPLLAPAVAGVMWICLGCYLQQVTALSFVFFIYC